MENFYDFFNKSDEDRKVVGLYLQEPKLEIHEIARISNKSIGEIYRILRINEIEPNRLKGNHKKVESLAKLGWGIREIADFTGYSTRN
ncbi:MAG: hypothetical protein EB127_26975, partial [Alphaproteobacteria bacterium]|nr:hypothetical protein [Alphaproteobacteria bacterium]